MKFLLVIAVIVVAFWIWRNNRLPDRDETRAPERRSPPQPAAMVACAQCGMHLPEIEAIGGTAGVYCCHEHRRQREEALG